MQKQKKQFLTVMNGRSLLIQVSHIKSHQVSHINFLRSAYWFALQLLPVSLKRVGDTIQKLELEIIV